jgi:phosphoenolpyruvate---glycerone phosphotransferase subunit DhaL
MNGPAAAPASAVRAWLIATSERVMAESDELSRLDGLAGDGDLGATLSTGFGSIADRLDGADGADVGDLCSAVGSALSRDAPSTFGTLLGLALRDAAPLFRGRDELSAADVVGLLAALAESVGRRGQVEPGQRTMLDALVAARDEARDSLGAEADVLHVLSAAAAGARRGAEVTASMSPQVGRASWVGARATGHPDAGATAIAVILGALSDAAQSR